MKKITIDEDEDAEINGLPAYIMSVQDRRENTQYKIVVIEGQRTVYLLLIHVNSKMYNDFYDKIKNIIMSFRELY